MSVKIYTGALSALDAVQHKHCFIMFSWSALCHKKDAGNLILKVI
jgi:hypothetical protein